MKTRRFLTLTWLLVSCSWSCSESAPGTEPQPGGASSGSDAGASVPKKDAANFVSDVADKPTPADPDAALPTDCATPGQAGELYALGATNLAGTQRVPFCAFRGKVLLIVNVASHCGNTPQYAPLETLYESYRDKGFYVLGFPCNQFGKQEPGSAEEISTFCTDTYHITFPMFAKIDVNGPTQDPLYTWLKAQPGGSGDIDWNFAKFLIGRTGQLVKRWAAGVNPSPTATPEIDQMIQAELAK